MEPWKTQAYEEFLFAVQYNGKTPATSNTEIRDRNAQWNQDNTFRGQLRKQLDGHNAHNAILIFNQGVLAARKAIQDRKPEGQRDTYTIEDHKAAIIRGGEALYAFTAQRGNGADPKEEYKNLMQTIGLVVERGDAKDVKYSQEAMYALMNNRARITSAPPDRFKFDIAALNTAAAPPPAPATSSPPSAPVAAATPPAPPVVAAAPAPSPSAAPDKHDELLNILELGNLEGTVYATVKTKVRHALRNVSNDSLEAFGKGYIAQFNVELGKQGGHTNEGHGKSVVAGARELYLESLKTSGPEKALADYKSLVAAAEIVVKDAEPVKKGYTTAALNGLTANEKRITADPKAAAEPKPAAKAKPKANEVAKREPTTETDKPAKAPAAKRPRHANLKASHVEANVQELQKAYDDISTFAKTTAEGQKAIMNGELYRNSAGQLMTSAADVYTKLYDMKRDQTMVAQTVQPPATGQRADADVPGQRTYAQIKAEQAELTDKIAAAPTADQTLLEATGLAGKAQPAGGHQVAQAPGSKSPKLVPTG